MKKVAIKTLLLDHWRAQNRAVRFAQDTHIKGDNRQGKSSVVNAILWLLTGSDEYDRTNYNLFDITVEQTYENAVPASVEAVFDIDGNEYNHNYVTHEQLQEGAMLEFKMSETPNKLRGIDIEDAPYSFSKSLRK